MSRKYVLIKPAVQKSWEAQNIRTIEEAINAAVDTTIKVNDPDTGLSSISGKIKITNGDATSDYLNEKLIAGTGITLTKSNTGGQGGEILTADGHVPVTLATNHGLGLSGQVLNMGTPSTCTLATTNSVTTTTHTHALSGITTTHATLTDMPDTLGVNTDHDVRYVAKVQAATPTVPTPFKGQIWHDTDAVSNPSFSFVVVTDTYTVADGIELVVCNKTTAFTVTIPTASASGRKIVIKNINTGTITVSKAGDTIDGLASQTVAMWSCMAIVDYAANKWVIL